MILDTIVEKRLLQLHREKLGLSPEAACRQAETMAENPTDRAKDFHEALSKSGLSVIAEVKKASPSKGVICEDFQPQQTAIAYQKAGADAVSVLTEEYYFQGGRQYLADIRKQISLPILRKDFIVDPYQIYDAKIIGADAVLLIAAILDTEKLKSFRNLAESLGLACLAEVHNDEELDSVLEAGCSIIGINNRDLKTFQVDLETTARLAEKVPKGKLLVSESGIRDHGDMERVKTYGADGVLVGETLMRSDDIEAELKELRKGL